MSTLPITYTKDCDCQIDHGPVASTGRLVHSYEQRGHATYMTTTMIPGPSCEKCFKPWKVAQPSKP